GDVSGEHSATRCISAAAESNSMSWQTHPERRKAALARLGVSLWLLPPCGEVEGALARESHAAVGVARALTRPLGFGTREFAGAVDQRPFVRGRGQHFVLHRAGALVPVRDLVAIGQCVDVDAVIAARGAADVIEHGGAATLLAQAGNIRLRVPRACALIHVEGMARLVTHLEGVIGIRLGTLP